MSIITTERRVHEFKIENCICGQVVDINARETEPWHASASIRCSHCGLGMHEITTSFGCDGLTLIVLAQRVVDRWNRVMG